MPIAPIVTALPHRLLVTLALLLSLDVQALTLGRVQGAALIGLPLEVVVQVQLEPNQNITSACFEADIFHADTRQNPDGVQVRLEPAAAANAATLRITSSSRVDEPVVTIYVRAGCALMSSRRYVLLADIISEQAPAVPQVDSVALVDSAGMAGPVVADGGAAAPAATAAASAQSPGRSDATIRSAVAGQPPVASESRRSDQVETRRVAPARPAAAARVAPQAPPRRVAAPPAATAPATTRSPGQPRLELESLEVLSERVATLKSNASASAQLSDHETREVERLDRLDASVKALLALAERNEASLLDVRNRLEKAQADRFSNTVVYALFGMLLLSLLAIAYLLARISRGPETTGARWFDAAPGSSAPDSVLPASVSRPMPGASRDAQTTVGASPDRAGVSATAALAQGERPTDRAPIEPTRPMPEVGLAPATAEGHAQVDVSLVEMSESTFDRLMLSGSSHSAVRRVHETVPTPASRVESVLATAPMLSGSRINADDLIDIRLRAEFFVTLGQTDQAVQVLEARIEQDAASCPQAFLDLFQLFHSLGLKADFNQLRDDFLRLFNARVPEFADFDDEGRTLEDYPGAVDRLIRVWSRSTALEALEQLIHASSGVQTGHDAFDLAAFRDLLMLHAVAQTVRPVGPDHSGGFRPQPAAVGDGKQIDIDLSALFASGAAPTLVLTQSGSGTGAAAVADGSTASVNVDLRLDVDAPPQVDTAPRSDNLIDFDLGDTDVVKKSDRAS